MEITIGLVPNCSEFAFYVNLDKSSKTAREKLEKMLEEIKIAREEENDKKLEKYGLSSGCDYGCDEDTIFGIRIYKISGETSDMGQGLRIKLEKTGVEFEQKEPN